VKRGALNSVRVAAVGGHGAGEVDETQTRAAGPSVRPSTLFVGDVVP